jgi:hypothetical protein
MTVTEMTAVMMGIAVTAGTVVMATHDFDADR